MKDLRIAIIGGGAAGFFAAIRAAELAYSKRQKVYIQLFEASSRFLSKVLISGGGRCNVTYHNYDPNVFCKSYPRGNQELISPMHQFQAQDTVKWFEERGVYIKTEEDGRMFPVTDQSSTVVSCLLEEARRFKIELFLRHPVEKIEYKDSEFTLHILDKEWKADRIMIATGSSPLGYKMAKSVGHTIEELAPSLFSFNIKHPLLSGLEGISFPSAKVEIVFEDKTKFSESAPVLITHWGLSGPGILKLSAWAAREMQKFKYKAKLTVNWIGVERVEDALNLLMKLKTDRSKAHIANARLEMIPQRFWEKLLTVQKIPLDLQWANVNKTMIQNLAQSLAKMEMDVHGKSRNKEEFVECGGVSKKEINWKTMESKVTQGLYFGGEVIDVDGITGGFNLQSAWTAGYIAGTSMIQFND
jgi:predicted Rossmann fold flavoprotein